VARLLGSAIRTVRYWKARAAKELPPLGRPPHDAQAQLEVARAVVPELRRQGYSAGWRAIAAALESAPQRLVQEQTAAAKARRRKRDSRRAAKRRLEITVAGIDVMWSLDATHVGRTAQGRAIEAQLVREVWSQRTLAMTVGKTVVSADARHVLELAAAERGGRYPLVLVTDNGSAYTSESFERFLAEHGVVHLLSLPRTPRHNPWVERGHRDVKAESGLGKGVLIPSLRAARVRLEAALDCVDGHRLRATLGYRTARAVDALAAAPYDERDRARLGNVVRRRTTDVLQRQLPRREERVLCREVVLVALEEMELLTRTRGGQLVTAVKGAGLS